MRTYLDCIPCFIRQTLEAVQLVSSDASLHESVLRQVLRWAAEMDMSQSPPAMGQRIHRLIRTLTNNDDPYQLAKAQQNLMALHLLDSFKTQLETATDPLDMAVRLAIAGNVMDLGLKGNITESEVRATIYQALATPLVGEPEAFKKAVARAQRILYLTDNAGEIAFDGLLIQQIGPARVTVAVRGRPILNDATLEDARAVGLHHVVELMDNGSDAPGTLLGDCSQEFRRRFYQADLIIAKGQGNYETLSQEPGPIFFLFKAKCPVIARHVAVPLGTHLLLQQG